MTPRPEAHIEEVSVASYEIPTDAPESDGTLCWDSTTIVVVHVSAGGATGLGYTYAHASTGALIRGLLAEVVHGRDAMDVPASWRSMVDAIRNQGRPGLSSMAIAAVDAALWDLKARLLDLPLVSLLGAARSSLPIYASGGFTSYDRNRLEHQLAAWGESGIRRMKIKVGREPALDVERVAAARGVIGPEGELFVDANGAWSRKQALHFAELLAREGVTWLEEPVSSDDLDGLRVIRDRAPAGLEVTAGEYGYDLPYFRRMLEAGAVDVLQADLTRCAGITGFLGVASLCRSRSLQLSSHCAPGLHLHAGCATDVVRHAEYFHDHVRIEEKLFDGVVRPVEGVLTPDLSRVGHGLELRRADARRFAL